MLHFLKDLHMHILHGIFLTHTKYMCKQSKGLARQTNYAYGFGVYYPTCIWSGLINISSGHTGQLYQ